MIIEFEELTISEAEAFYKLLKESIDSLDKTQLTLDFNKVEKIDLSIIQILISLKNYANELNIDIKYTNLLSTQLQQTIRRYNLEKILGIEI